MSVTVECPAPDCTEPVERGGGWSENRSRWCDSWDRHVHSHCQGSFDLIGMEVVHLRCACHCHATPAARTQKGLDE